MTITTFDYDPCIHESDYLLSYDGSTTVYAPDYLSSSNSTLDAIGMFSTISGWRDYYIAPEEPEVMDTMVMMEIEPTMFLNLNLKDNFKIKMKRTRSWEVSEHHAFAGSMYFMKGRSKHHINHKKHKKWKGKLNWHSRKSKRAR